MCGSCLDRGEEVVGFEVESLGGYGFIRLNGRILLRTLFK